MLNTNLCFRNEIGGTAINRRGYDVRSFQDKIVPYDIEEPERGKQVKNHTTIIDPKNSGYYKSVTEFDDGTVVSHLSKWDTGKDGQFSRTRVKGRDGKWHLLEYRNNFFGWQNSELLKRGKKNLDDIKGANILIDKDRFLSNLKLNAPVSPRYRVDFRYGVYPELMEIQGHFPQNVNVDTQYLALFPERAEKCIQNSCPLKGLTKKEAKQLMQIYFDILKEQAESKIERGKQLVEQGQTWLNALKKIHV